MNLTTVRALVLLAVLPCAPMRSAEGVDTLSVKWQFDYAAAMVKAEQEGVPMAVYFAEDGNHQCSLFDNQLMQSADAIARLNCCCCVRLSLDAEIMLGGKPVRLIEHRAFAGLEGGAGLVFFDFRTSSSVPGAVLCSLPFRDGDPVELQNLDFLQVPKANQPKVAGPVEWLTDYSKATARAEAEKRMLLIYFHREDGSGGCGQFEAKALSNPSILAGLSTYVCLKLAHDSEVNVDGASTVLLRHSSFSEMVGLPGLAIVDFSDPNAPHYGQVVSTFPFLQGKPYAPSQMEVILNLPPGKLTQRTLIYAVRTHPDAPKSTSGELDAYLVSEAESHSAYQARIRLQGHHSWESRFHRINSRLPGGLLASEVCAESWPGESLLEAAIDCVQCWRLSSGHWRSVKAAHPVFGYDIRRGSNGIWYATGIFGKRGH